MPQQAPRLWLFSVRLLLAIIASNSGLVPLALAVDGERSAAPADLEPAYRGPVDLAVLGSDEAAITVNELSGTLSLVDLRSGSVLHELFVGGRPSSIAVSASGKVVVSARNSGKLIVLSVVDGKMEVLGEVIVGFEPLGVAVHQSSAFVGLLATGEIAEVNLDSLSLVRKFFVGRWPRYLTISDDGARIAVGLSGDSNIAVVDVAKGEVLYKEPVSGGINIGHLEIGDDNQVYFPWMVYRSNPITVGNIRRGWVLASRIARIRMDGPAYREAISLDVPGRAMSDPHGIAISPEGRRLVVSSSGTHELLVYERSKMPFVGAGGPGDLIDNRLLRDKDAFYRIELGGRPLGLEMSAGGNLVYAANHLLDCVQVIDLDSRRVVKEIELGPKPENSDARLVHQGMALFFDASRSLDQWYSCQSCHLDGLSNSKPMDTWNDGTELTSKTVLPLEGVTATGPWTWHGWQEDLRDSLQNSFVSTMKGKPVSAEEIEALLSYLETLEPKPSPFLVDGELSAAAERGKQLFQSADYGCADCHSGAAFTDGLKHDVGLTRESDMYQGYNTPSLRGLHRKSRFLHDGRAKTIERVLTKYHRPDEIGGGATPADEELADLIAYLKSL